MTWQKLRDMISSGIGQGHGEAYRPFLQVKRGTSSPKGNQSIGPLPGCVRPYHALTRVERQLALLCYWLGASDVREQFPAWPFAHPHPLAGADNADEYRYVLAPGLIAIAEDAGIDHGVFPGTNVPYVATLDLVVTVPGRIGPRLVVISCKAGSDLEAAPPTSRMIERLELERRYCKSISARYHVAHELAISRVLLQNLEICGAALAVPVTAEGERLVEPFLHECLNRMPIRQAIAMAAAHAGVENSSAWAAFYRLAWLMEIDVDLSRPLVTTQIALQGGQALRRALQQKLLAEGCQ